MKYNLNFRWLCNMHYFITFWSNIYIVMSYVWKLFEKLLKSEWEENNSYTTDGMSNNNEIVYLFDDKFKTIIDDPQSNISGSGFCPDGDDTHIFHEYFIPKYFDHIINNLNTGLGFDFIHSNHFKFSDTICRTLLGKLFTSMLSHTFISTDMLRGQSYQACFERWFHMQSKFWKHQSMYLELFEYSLVLILKQNVIINPLKFRFTTGSHCDMAITFLKETILSYKKKSNVHCASIDLSKAFDKTTIKILIDKLSNTNLPAPLVKIISHMLSNTYVDVCFNDFIGNEWQVKKGVR